MAQEQKTKQSRKTDDEEVTVESEHTRSDEVCAEAEDMCCAIDEVLAESEDVVDSDETILAKGDPHEMITREWAEAQGCYAELLAEIDALEEDEELSEELKEKAREVAIAYQAALERYIVAYENITGMSYMPPLTYLLSRICAC